MKVKLLLFLCEILCGILSGTAEGQNKYTTSTQHLQLYTNTEADQVLLLSVLHEDFGILGCSDYDQEYMYALDGEEKWYADYKKETGVGPQLPLGGHFINPDGYQFAKVYEQVCRRNLKALKKTTKGLQLEQGKTKTFPSKFICD